LDLRIARFNVLQEAVDPQLIGIPF